MSAPKRADKGPEKARRRGPDQPTSPAEPHERIDDLVRMLSEPSASDDPSALAGQLGLAWLEVYEAEGDEKALATGLSCLEETIEAGPDHGERSSWFFWLGLGYAERGRRLRSLEDYHRSIEWLSTLYASSRPPCPVRDRAAMALADVGWERFWLLRQLETFDAATALTEVDRLIARMGPLLTNAADPGHLPWVRLVLGLARLERYELSEDRTDLDRGIDLLATASLWDVTAGTPLLARIGSELANAWRRRGMLDSDATCLERAIEVGRRTIRLAGPGDGAVWKMLHLYQAHACEAQWLAMREAEYLDGAIASWRVLVEDDLTCADALDTADDPLSGPSGAARRRGA